jgi:hypothetical protein
MISPYQDSKGGLKAHSSTNVSGFLKLELQSTPIFVNEDDNESLTN